MGIGRPPPHEVELADARGPGGITRCSVVFAQGPEAHAIGRIDGGHTIIAPAPVGAGLAPRAAEHCSFPLPEITARVSF